MKLSKIMIYLVNLLLDFRHPDHKDPEHTPSKLFRIEQIKTTRHHPWWQKKILSELKLDNEVSGITYS